MVQETTRVVPVPWVLPIRTSRFLSEKVTTQAIRRGSTPTLALQPRVTGHCLGSACRLRQSGRFHAFAQTCWILCNVFVQKPDQLPCRKRIRLSSAETASLHVSRV